MWYAPSQLTVKLRHCGDRVYRARQLIMVNQKSVYIRASKCGWDQARQMVIGHN
jgi:hypothetical protein